MIQNSMPKTITANENQIRMLIVATDLTKISGLTVGNLPTVKSLSKKLHGLVQPSVVYYDEQAKEHTVEFEDDEWMLLTNFWKGFEMGLVPRGGAMLDVIESVDKMMKE